MKHANTLLQLASILIVTILVAACGPESGTQTTLEGAPENPVSEELTVTGSGVSTFAENPMVLGGIVDSAKWGSTPTIVDGESYNILNSENRIGPTNQTMVFLRNDFNNLYGMVDVLGDETDDVPTCTWHSNEQNEYWSCVEIDTLWLFSDNDANGVATPFVDYRYGICHDNDLFFVNVPPVETRPDGFIHNITTRLSRINLINTSGSNNGCDSGGATSASYYRGFGVTHNSNRAHRYFEFSIPLNELCVADDGTTFLMSGAAYSSFKSVPVQLSNVSGNGCPSASAHLKIRTSEEICGSLFPELMRMVYAENTHPSFSIETDITISDRNPANETLAVTRTYNIPPKELVQLGCSADGVTGESWQQWEHRPTQVFWSHE